MRLTSEELKKIMKEEGVSRIWSWSKFNCFRTSPFEYYLKYIQKIEEDRADSIYVTTGGIAHEILERYYGKEISYKEMIDEFEDGWLSAFDISELKFNRSDDVKNKNIAESYRANLVHFFKNHIPLKHKPIIEDFAKIKIGKHLFQGYIDCYFTDEEENIHIVDFKTSSIYKGEKAKKECGQLVCYAISMMQKGIPLEKIKICWNFLKYVNVLCEKPEYVKVSWTTVKGEEKVKEKLDKAKLIKTIKTSVKAWLKQLGYTKSEIENYIDTLEDTEDINNLPNEVLEHFEVEDLDIENKPRQIERNKIGETLKADCKRQMKRLGYDEKEIENTVEEFELTNSIESLPLDVQAKYKIDDCYVYVDLTEEFVNEWIEHICFVLEDIEYREKEYAKTKNENLFWDSEEDVEKESFYFSNLCSYSPNLHKPYAKYLQKLQEEKEHENDLFASLGIEIEENELNKSINSEKENNKEDEDDLSWLDDL